MGREEGDSTQLAIKLAEAHRLTGCSLQEVAAQLRVNKATLSRWLRGKHVPQPAQLRALCAVYGITIHDLYEQVPVSQQHTMHQSTDEVSRFIQQDLTTCLTLALTIRNHHELQRQMLQQLASYEEEYDMHDAQVALNRRDALRRIAALVLTFSAFHVSSSSQAEDVIRQCAAGITACVKLSKDKDLRFVSDAITHYTALLESVTNTGTATQQQHAADVLVQCLLLQSTLAKHVSTNEKAIHAAIQAEHYASLANNPLLQIVSLRMLAGAQYFANNYQAALTADQKAHYVLQETTKRGKMAVPPIIASYVHAGLARDQSALGRRREALQSLQVAHTSFYRQPADEPLPGWLHHNKTSLGLVDGVTHMHLGEAGPAIQAFQEVAALPAASVASKIEAIIEEARVEVTREQGRDMEKCIDLWVRGIEGAKAIQSQQWFNDSVQTLVALRAAWPGEPRVKRLQELVVHW